MGSQSGQCKISLARSAINSDTTQNSSGQGDPPKVRRRLNKSMSPMVMMHLAAVSPCNVIRLYAPFKSVLARRIFVNGYWRRMETM